MTLCKISEDPLPAFLVPVIFSPAPIFRKILSLILQALDPICKKRMLTRVSHGSALHLPGSPQTFWKFNPRVQESSLTAMTTFLKIASPRQFWPTSSREGSAVFSSRYIFLDIFIYHFILNLSAVNEDFFARPLK